MVGTNPNTDPSLVNTSKDCTQEPIPEGKNGAVIAIPFLDNHRVVYPMHGRRNKKYPKDCFKPLGNFQAAMVKLGTKHQGAFKYQHPKGTRTQEKYDGYLDNG